MDSSICKQGNLLQFVGAGENKQRWPLEKEQRVLTNSSLISRANINIFCLVKRSLKRDAISCRNQRPHLSHAIPGGHHHHPSEFYIYIKNPCLSSSRYSAKLIWRGIVLKTNWAGCSSRAFDKYHKTRDGALLHRNYCRWRLLHCGTLYTRYSEETAAEILFRLGFRRATEDFQGFVKGIAKWLIISFGTSKLQWKWSKVFLISPRTPVRDEPPWLYSGWNICIQ